MYHFAIIGCGNIAALHAENILKTGKLIAVCDTVAATADAFASRYGAMAYYSIEDLLKNKEVQVVCICTPTGYHAEHCIKALQAGKHIICESPMCLTTAAAWQMIETEKFCRQKLYVVKPLRFNSLLQQVKILLEEKRLGKIYSFQLNCSSNRPAAYFTGWRSKLFPAGGSLFTEFNQYVDVLLWLFGAVKEVRGFAGSKTSNTEMDIEEAGVVAVQMQDDVLGTINWSVINTENENRSSSLTITAAKGRISLGGSDLNELLDQQFDPHFLLPKINEKSTTDGYELMYEQLISALNSKENFSSALDALPVVETIENMYKAVGLPSYHSV